MPVVDINTLYTYFQENDYPNEEQFKNLIDTLAANRGLVILSPGTISWNAPQGNIIDDIVVEGGSVDEFYISVGTTIDGQDILKHEFVDNDNRLFSPKYRSRTAETIYFSEVDEDATIKLYIK